MPAKPRTRDPRSDHHPLRHTTASVMLAVAVDASEQTMTALGLAAGYGTSNRSSLSHMASGIDPIPLDRAEALARAVGLDEGAFTLAVLHQRHPEVAEALWDAKGVRHPPVLPPELLTVMRERLLASDRAFACAALPILARPHPWDDVATDLAAL